MFNKKNKEPQEKKLSDFDNTLLGQMRSKTEKEVIELTSINKIIEKICKLCGGKLNELNPKIKMEDLILHECEKCGEREYLKEDLN